MSERFRLEKAVLDKRTEPRIQGSKIGNDVNQDHVSSLEPKFKNAKRTGGSRLHARGPRSEIQFEVGVANTETVPRKSIIGR